MTTKRTKSDVVCGCALEGQSLQEVLRYLGPFDLVTASRVCREWFRVVSIADELWYELFLRVWPNEGSAASGTSWHDRFVRRWRENLFPCLGGGPTRAFSFSGVGPDLSRGGHLFPVRRIKKRMTDEDDEEEEEGAGDSSTFIVSHTLVCWDGRFVAWLEHAMADNSVTLRGTTSAPRTLLQQEELNWPKHEITQRLECKPECCSIEVVPDEELVIVGLGGSGLAGIGLHSGEVLWETTFARCLTEAPKHPPVQLTSATRVRTWMVTLVSANSAKTFIALNIHDGSVAWTAAFCQTIRIFPKHIVPFVASDGNRHLFIIAPPYLAVFDCFARNIQL
jgi:hypothetical protein